MKHKGKMFYYWDIIQFTFTMESRQKLGEEYIESQQRSERRHTPFSIHAFRYALNFALAFRYELRFAFTWQEDEGNLNIFSL